MGIRSFIFLISFFLYSSIATADIIDDAYTFINDSLDWRKSGIYTFATEFFAEFVQYSIIATIEFKIFAMTFAWDTARALLENLSITTQLQIAWSSIDSKVLNVLTALKIPDALNIVLSGSVTKFILRFIF